jgi:hypothetical protein
MTAEQEMENNLDENEVAREGAPKTLASFRQHLTEKRREEDEDTEITIKHTEGKGDKKKDDGDEDDDDKKSSFKKKDKKPFDKGDDDDDGDGDEGKKKFKPFSPKNESRREEEDECVGDKKKKKKMEEETQAAASLHPKGVKGEPLDTSRLEKMKHMVTHMSGLDKTDFTEWFKKSLDRWGPNKDQGVPDNSKKNTASIDSKFGPGPKTKMPMPKLNVREDLNEVLGGTELTEEAIEKVATLFEAAVHIRQVLETERLEEEYVEALGEEIAHFTSVMTEKLDNYLDYVVENWMAENQIAVESALRTEITTDFIDGIKEVFAEHYIDVPETKINVMEAMAEKIDALEGRLETIVSENALLKDALIGGAKQEVVEHVGKELTQSQMEKFATLAEGIEFDGDFDVYANKLAIVKEQYFNSQNTKRVTSSNILEESFEGEEEGKTNQYVDPAVNRYAAAISATVKKAAQG